MPWPPQGSIHHHHHRETQRGRQKQWKKSKTQSVAVLGCVSPAEGGQRNPADLRALKEAGECDGKQTPSISTRDADGEPSAQLAIQENLLTLKT